MADKALSELKGITLLSKHKSQVALSDRFGCDDDCYQNMVK